MTAISPPRFKGVSVNVTSKPLISRSQDDDRLPSGFDFDVELDPNHPTEVMANSDGVACGLLVWTLPPEPPPMIAVVTCSFRVHANGETVTTEPMRKAGVTGELVYDAEGFWLRQPDRAQFNLANVYADYCRSSKEDRERLLKAYLSAWASTGMPVPDDFEDVTPDIVPILRSRSYFEVDLKHASPDGDPTRFPYQIIADHLCLSVAYDLPQSTMTVNQEQLDKWGVSLYEALETAKANLRERTESYAQIGSLYSMVHGDSYDATRLIQMTVKGDHIAMVPNRDTLLIAGSEDEESLASMLKPAEEGLAHERFISGMALRLMDGEWEPWLPPRDHPLHHQFAELNLQVTLRDYANQKELLEAELLREGRPIRRVIVRRAKRIDGRGDQLRRLEQGRAHAAPSVRCHCLRRS
jgi:hypothetical protein